MMKYNNAVNANYLNSPMIKYKNAINENYLNSPMFTYKNMVNQNYLNSPMSRLKNGSNKNYLNSIMYKYNQGKLKQATAKKTVAVLTSKRKRKRFKKIAVNIKRRSTKWKRLRKPLFKSKNLTRRTVSINNESNQ